MNNSNHIAILLMLLGALTSSFIAPISKISISISPASLLCFANIVSILAHYLYLLISKNKLNHKIPIQSLLFSVIGGVCITWSYIVFAHAIQASQNLMLPTITFELYPLGIILFSNIILFREKFHFSNIWWLIVSVFGILMITSNGSIDLSKSMLNAVNDSSNKIGLAFLSVILLSLGMTCVSRGGKEYNEREEKPVYSSMVARIAGAISVLPIVILSDSNLLFEITTGWKEILFYGVVILTLSNIAYYKAVAMSDSHLINVVWYITPIFSIIWLYILGFGNISVFVGIGAVCIIVSNVMINLRNVDAPSSKVTVLWVLIAGVVITLFDGNNLNSYFDAIAAPLIFFGLMFGFIITKINSRSDDERTLLLEISSSLKKIDNLKVEENLLKIVNTNNLNIIRLCYNIILHEQTNDLDLKTLDKLIVSKTSNVALGEIFGLFITGGLTLVLAIFARPYGFVYDCFALIVSTAIVYLSASIYDAMITRKQVYIEKNDATQSYKVSNSVLSSSPIGEQIILLFMQSASLMIFVVIFYFKISK